MKTIKIKFIDFWKGFDKEKESFVILQILRKHYEVEICDNADYVFFSAMGERHWFVPDKCIKIFYTGENLTPDFNACDYAIGFDYLDYGDRYYRFPFYLIKHGEAVQRMECKHLLPDDWDLHREKPNFCSFTVSNHLCAERNNAFWELSKYKKVDSGGKVNNNIGHLIDNKFEFDKTHKFSLCFENTTFPGYTTEKIVDAFAARTIPIYWGDPEITKVFNEKAFVNVHAYASFDDVIKKIKELDNDDEKYEEMLRQPALLSDSLTYEDEIKQLEKRLLYIFEQPIEKAYRRDRGWYGRNYINSRKKLIPWRYYKEFIPRRLGYYSRAVLNVILRKK